MEPLKIFIIEDDQIYGKILQHHLSKNPDNEVIWYKTGKECLDNLYLNPDVISLDYMLPDISGKECYAKITKQNPDIPVIMVSGQQDVQIAIELLKDGVYDYFVKNQDTRDRLWNAVNKIRNEKKLHAELDELKKEVKSKYAFHNILKGNSKSMEEVFNWMEKAVKTNITVSVSGETGTGKELVAKAIHYNSARAKKPFVAINVSAIPDTLIESELFGYEKGAFTGANTRKTGKFEEASGGTLFLDEISDMDIAMQAKLLRVLQEKEITRIGGNKVIPVDVRLIVATNEDLSEEVKKGTFRKDLYYRLLGLPVKLPPLRMRDKDILILANHFIQNFCKENNLPVKKLSEEAGDKLLSYSYPGNVRELRSIIELAVVMSDGSVISASHIHFNSDNMMTDFLNKESTLDEYNRKIIHFYIDKYQGDIGRAAEILQIGKSTIYRILKKEKSMKNK